MSNNNNFGNFGRRYYESPNNNFPQLHGTASQPRQGFPPPSGPPAPVQGFQHQHHGFFHSLPPSLQSTSSGTFGLSPNTPHFQHQLYYQGPIIRPESSISNASFATQVSRAPSTPHGMTQQAPPFSRPPYLGQQSNASDNRMQVYGGDFTNVMSGLGARLSNTSLNGGTTSRPMSIVNGGSEPGNSSGNGRNFSVSSEDSTSRLLVASIKNGETEDQYDRSLKRLDRPVKNPAPTLGPARFKDSKMFSTAQSKPDVDVTATPVPHHPQGPPATPNWLSMAKQGFYTPTLNEAFQALPFTELCRNVFASSSGVLRVKDIPYQTTRQEMIAFLGRNAQIRRQPEGSPYHAVHIMMERETGKTMDCFVEVSSPNEAAWIMRQFNARIASKRPPKVGDRLVEILFSSQDELLSELFPRAKHVRWSSGQPVVDTTSRKYYKDQDAAGFQGFIHPEELVMLQKHVNLSDRSLFASKSPCRVYESMVTTLYKYPWYAINYVKIKERCAIFDCFMELLRSLMELLRRGNHRQEPISPSSSLLQELVVAALTCPGFSEKQKSAIVARLHQNGYSSMTDGRSINVALGGVHEFSPVWPFAVLSYIAGVNDDLIKYFAELFRDATFTAGSTSLAALRAAEAAGSIGNPMGRFEINYGPEPSELSMAEIAKIEYNKIEQLLKAICRSESEQPTLITGAPASAVRSSSDKGMRDGYSVDGFRSIQ